MNRLALGLFASAAALLLGAPASAQNTIKVGIPMPLSGPAALYGEPAVKGARMFVDEINAAGGVLARKSSSWSATARPRLMRRCASHAK
jgi:branched-chain amino acid transport system substrate-binding protein